MEECELFEVTLEDGVKVKVYVPTSFSALGMRIHCDQIFGYKWHKSEQVEINQLTSKE